MNLKTEIIYFVKSIIYTSIIISILAFIGIIDFISIAEPIRSILLFLLVSKFESDFRIKELEKKLKDYEPK